MKPRNKYEKRVAELNATLSEDIAVRDIDWVKNQNYGRTDGQKKETKFYFTLITQLAEFQVKRLYRGYKYQDKHFDHYFFVEIMREFNDGKQKLYFGKQRTMGCYFDCFTYGSDMELRQNYRNYAGNSIDYLFEISWGEHLQSKGKRIACDRIDPNELARVIKNNPVAENLYKNHDSLFGHLLWNPYPKQICRAITLAKRHGFAFNDTTTSVWFDMVRSICYCKKDYHNPVFIAPKEEELMTLHDKFVDMEFRKRRRDREERERRKEENRIRREYEANRKQLEQDKTINEKYIKRRKRFYDMVLSDGLIECRVLRDVKAFEEEGTMMQHCVFRCKYYEKPYSLILSARINDKRIETIEVDLTNYTIKQCYGKHDQFTMYHQRILDLVNAQMDTIKHFNATRKRTTKQMKVV
jgi:hypothetical protein